MAPLLFSRQTACICKWAPLARSPGNAREMGLGPWPDVPLKRARQRRDKCRVLLTDDVDPIEARRVERRTRSHFQDRGRGVHRGPQGRVEEHKHAKQWENTLTAYAYPTLGKQLVSEIDTALVKQCLRPILNRQDRNRRQGARPNRGGARPRDRPQAPDGRQPARWKGHLQNLLPAPTKIARTESTARRCPREGGRVHESAARLGLAASRRAPCNSSS
jgi:hypothetical protein